MERKLTFNFISVIANGVINFNWIGIHESGRSNKKSNSIGKIKDGANKIKQKLREYKIKIVGRHISRFKNRKYGY